MIRSRGSVVQSPVAGLGLHGRRALRGDGNHAPWKTPAAIAHGVKALPWQARYRANAPDAGPAIPSTSLSRAACSRCWVPGQPTRPPAGRHCRGLRWWCVARQRGTSIVERWLLDRVLHRAVVGMRRAADRRRRGECVGCRDAGMPGCRDAGMPGCCGAQNDATSTIACVHWSRVPGQLWQTTLTAKSIVLAKSILHSADPLFNTTATTLVTLLTRSRPVRDIGWLARALGLSRVSLYRGWHNTSLGRAFPRPKNLIDWLTLLRVSHARCLGATWPEAANAAGIGDRSIWRLLHRVGVGGRELASTRAVDVSHTLIATLMQRVASGPRAAVPAEPDRRDVDQSSFDSTHSNGVATPRRLRAGCNLGRESSGA